MEATLNKSLIASGMYIFLTGKEILLKGETLGNGELSNERRDNWGRISVFSGMSIYTQPFYIVLSPKKGMPI